MNSCLKLEKMLLQRKFVIPAQAGIHNARFTLIRWIPGQARDDTGGVVL